jgi:hypothetical protein
VFEAIGLIVAGRERQLFLVVPIAVAFRENQFVVHDHADADAGRVPVLEGFGHVGVEPSSLFATSMSPVAALPAEVRTNRLTTASRQDVEGIETRVMGKVSLRRF